MWMLRLVLVLLEGGLCCVCVGSWWSGVGDIVDVGRNSAETGRGW